MTEEKVIMDDVIALLPQEQQGIVKLAVTLSDTLSAKEQAQNKFQSTLNMLKSLLNYIAEDQLIGAYNWKDFTMEYIKDPSFIKKDRYENITKKYFSICEDCKIPNALAMSSLQPVLNKLVTNLKEQYPGAYDEATGIAKDSEDTESSEDDVPF